jgi:hypothetical protein
MAARGDDLRALTVPADVTEVALRFGDPTHVNECLSPKRDGR